jgi:hypothetical protein
LGFSIRWKNLCFFGSLFVAKFRMDDMRKHKILAICCGLGLTMILSFIPSPSAAQYKTLGPGGCGLGQNNCHAKENDWWKDDAHKTTVDAFYDDPQQYEKIAQLAGVGAANMFKGNQSCMSCHGTVISGNETRNVEDGVSCESCHGAGSDYKEPHSEGDPKLGVNRPGRIKALQLGMVELKNLDNRANTCVRCHYITDQKLIAAGHPDGARFNYISGIKKVARHWKRQPGTDDLAKAPFEKAMNARGPVAQIATSTQEARPGPTQSARPSVETPERAIKPAPPLEPPAKMEPQPVAQPASQPDRQPERLRPSGVTEGAFRPFEPEPVKKPPGRSMPLPPQPLPLSPPSPVEPVIVRADSAGHIDLPPFPSVSDTMSVEEILVILKKRLELLYQKTGRYAN